MACKRDKNDNGRGQYECHRCGGWLTLETVHTIDGTVDMLRCVSCGARVFDWVDIRKKKRCALCGAEFLVRSLRQEYCPDCREKALLQQQKKYKVMGRCQICGAIFFGDRKRKYCKRCRDIVLATRKKKWNVRSKK